MDNKKITRGVRLALALFGGGALALTPASAIEADLTAGGSVVLNGALFTTTDVGSTGTGVIESFVRIQRNGTEQGYNADARPVMPDVNTSPTFTRDILLGEVPTVVNPTGAPAGTYYEFLLDINQTNANPFLSLNSLMVFTSATALTSADEFSDLAGTTLRYNLDGAGDNRIQLNYSLNSGSGSGDLFVYIPVGLFAGAADDHFLYLYSMFGTEAGGTSYPSNDGFEEWAVRTADAPRVPDGGTTITLLGLALIGLTLLPRKFRTV